MLTADQLRLFWGKTDRQNADNAFYHPAIYHMLDVACVAQVLLEDPRVSPRWRSALAHALGADPGQLLGWVPFYIALHDIGKISAVFQGANEAQKQRLLRQSVSFDGWPADHPLRHEVISQLFIAESCDGAALPPKLRQVIGEALGGHHGDYQSSHFLNEARLRLQVQEPGEWAGHRSKAAEFLAGHLLKPQVVLPQPENISAATMALSGFLILCDWLGSHEYFFPLSENIDVDAYLAQSRRQASAVVSWAGFMVPVSSRQPADFSTLFRDIQSPRPLQLAIDAIPADILKEPSLTIIEAPTGEGKTEAALALAHRIGILSGTDEFYYALPTTGTSNSIFERVQKHIFGRLNIPTQTKLVHGQAFLVEDDLRIEPHSNGFVGGPVAPLEWFAPLKRALLAPFGTGTIDQAELAALNVDHVPLRMFGLAGKVVILDEIHSYDIYMSTIIERLLAWLSAMRTSVILLSATLPAEQRHRLINAYRASGSPAAAGEAYPNIFVTGRTGEPYQSFPPASQSSRKIHLRSDLCIDDQDAMAKAVWLLRQVEQGGCACWIANTVDRAQKIFEALEMISDESVSKTILHARFPLAQRQAIELSLRDAYGPDGQRPSRGIVIGTQVLEQSLDLDFDVMATDLAPVDLLLQRAGRLHRHNRTRPSFHSEPRLYVNVPSGQPEIEPLGVDQKIYQEYIQRRTWQAIARKDVIDLPADYRTLIQQVYCPDQPEQDDPLLPAWEQMSRELMEGKQKARQRILPEPSPRRSFVAGVAGRQFVEDESGAGWLVAQTRLGEETINVIPLELDGKTAVLHPEGMRLPLDQAAGRDLQLAMLRQNIRIGNKTAIRAIQAQEKPALFSQSGLLRRMYPLFLENGTCRLSADDGSVTLILDHRSGLIINREGKSYGK